MQYCGINSVMGITIAMAKHNGQVRYVQEPLRRRLGIVRRSGVKLEHDVGGRCTQWE